MSTLKVSLSGTTAKSYDNRTEAVVFSGDPLVLELHCQAPWNAGEPITCNMMSDGFVVGVYSGTGNIQIPAEDLTSGQYELFFNQNGSSASGYTATITKVLGSLSDDDMALTLDRNKRIMNTELHMLGVQGDMESEVLDFRFPRYADGIDLSEKIISIHYITFGGNASVDTATNVYTDDEYVYFSWVISSEVTAHVGEVNFAVHCTEVNPEGLLIYSWATQPAKLPVKETVTSIEQIRKKNPDAVNQWLEIMAKASEALEGYVLGIGPNGVLQWVEQAGGTGGGGTTDHSKLTNRNLANQHSIGAITGLQEALNGKQASGDYALKSEIPTVPTKLSELTGDELHRTVTDAEKKKWNTESGTGVQNASELTAEVPEGLTADPNVQSVLNAMAKEKGASGAFIARYKNTTKQELDAAKAEGKILYCYNYPQGNVAPVVVAGDYYAFCGIEVEYEKPADTKNPKNLLITQYHMTTAGKWLDVVQFRMPIKSEPSGGDYTLPQMTESVLGGAKAKEATPDQADFVGIDPETGLLKYAKGSGGGGAKPWKLIGQGTTSGPWGKVEFKTNLDGSPLNLQDVIIQITPKSTGKVFINVNERKFGGFWGDCIKLEYLDGVMGLQSSKESWWVNDFYAATKDGVIDKVIGFELTDAGSQTTVTIYGRDA